MAKIIYLGTILHELLSYDDSDLETKIITKPTNLGKFKFNEIEYDVKPHFEDINNLFYKTLKCYFDAHNSYLEFDPDYNVFIFGCQDTIFIKINCETKEINTITDKSKKGLLRYKLSSDYEKNKNDFLIKAKYYDVSKGSSRLVGDCGLAGGSGLAGDWGLTEADKLSESAYLSLMENFIFEKKYLYPKLHEINFAHIIYIYEKGAIEILRLNSAEAVKILKYNTKCELIYSKIVNIQSKISVINNLKKIKINSHDDLILLCNGNIFIISEDGEELFVFDKKHVNDFCLYNDKIVTIGNYNEITIYETDFLSSITYNVKLYMKHDNIIKISVSHNGELVGVSKSGAIYVWYLQRR